MSGKTGEDTEAEELLTSFIEDYEENKEVLQRIKDGSVKLVDAE